MSGLWTPSASILASHIPRDGSDESDGEFIMNQWMCSVQNTQTVVHHAPAAVSMCYIESQSIMHARVVPLVEYVQEFADAAADMVASAEALPPEQAVTVSSEDVEDSAEDGAPTLSELESDAKGPSYLEADTAPEESGDE